jgi:hypothetical protein
MNPLSLIDLIYPENEAALLQVVSSSAAHLGCRKALRILSYRLDGERTELEVEFEMDAGSNISVLIRK